MFMKWCDARPNTSRSFAGGRVLTWVKAGELCRSLLRCERRFFLGHAAAVVADFLNRSDSQTSLGEHRSLPLPTMHSCHHKPNETGFNKTEGFLQLLWPGFPLHDRIGADEFSPLIELLPAACSYFNSPQISGCGGGTATVCNNEFESKYPVTVCVWCHTQCLCG